MAPPTTSEQNRTDMSHYKGRPRSQTRPHLINGRSHLRRCPSSLRPFPPPKRNSFADVRPLPLTQESLDALAYIRQRFPYTRARGATIVSTISSSRRLGASVDAERFYGSSWNRVGKFCG